MMRRCPQCGTAADDRYGFCIKCGHEFSEIPQDKDTCPLCGYKNPEEAEYCVKCGSPLIFKQQMQENPAVVKNDMSPAYSRNKTSKWLIIFGYLFSILGGLLGLIIAIYLSTRKDPNARKHGHIQLAIFVFYIIIIAVFYATGNIPADIIAQYKQILAGNLTSI